MNRRGPRMEQQCLPSSILLMGNFIKQECSSWLHSSELHPSPWRPQLLTAWVDLESFDESDLCFISWKNIMCSLISLSCSVSSLFVSIFGLRYDRDHMLHPSSPLHHFCPPPPLGLHPHPHCSLRQNPLVRCPSLVFIYSVECDHLLFSYCTLLESVHDDGNLLPRVNVTPVWIITFRTAHILMFKFSWYCKDRPAVPAVNIAFTEGTLDCNQFIGLICPTEYLK